MVNWCWCRTTGEFKVGFITKKSKGLVKIMTRHAEGCGFAQNFWRQNLAMTILNSFFAGEFEKQAVNSFQAGYSLQRCLNVGRGRSQGGFFTMFVDRTDNTTKFRIIVSRIGNPYIDGRL